MTRIQGFGSHYIFGNLYDNSNNIPFLNASTIRLFRAHYVGVLYQLLRLHTMPVSTIKDSAVSMAHTLNVPPPPPPPNHGVVFWLRLRFLYLFKTLYRNNTITEQLQECKSEQKAKASHSRRFNIIETLRPIKSVRVSFTRSSLVMHGSSQTVQIHDTRTQCT